MFDISPILHPLFIALWTVVTASIVVFTYRRMHGLLSPTYLWSLLALRGVLVFLVLLLLLQPFYYIREPDPEHFHVTLLADASGSMRTGDCQGGSTRNEVLNTILYEEPALLTELNKDYRVRPFMFSGERQRLQDKVSILPGQTAIGQALKQTHAESTKDLPLGAVILLSDGHGNVTPSALDIAQRFRNDGIPISTIGIGEEGRMPDITLNAPDRTLQTRAGEPVTVPVSLKNTFDKSVDVSVNLTADGVERDAVELNLDADDSEKEVELQARPTTPGFHTYRVNIETDSAAATSPATDTDFVGVQAEEEPVYDILYLGAHLTPEHKFLRILADKSEKIHLSSIVKSGSGSSFFRTLPSDSAAAEEETDGFPTSREAYNEFEGIVLETRATEHLPQQAVKHIADFVNNRGGGLLAIGPIAHLNETIRAMLPVQKAKQKQTGGRATLNIEPYPVFSEHSLTALQAAGGPYVPAGITARSARELSTGARPTLAYPEQQDAVVAVQRYGSGRTAYSGIEETWRWRLANTDDYERYNVFWREFLSWLGAAAQPRITMPFDGKKKAVSETLELKTRILGQDFRPALNADVTTQISGPDDFSVEKSMASSFDTPGGYTALFTPPAEGEYEVKLRADLAGEPTLTETAHVLAVRKGKENQDVRYQETNLRDISRLTGGRFVPYADASRLLDDLPLADVVPVKEERVNWNELWLFLLPLLLLPAAEWYLRRRVGLR